MGVLKVQCGDWHLGWGYGGHTKLGNLLLDTETMVYTWKGKSQGRHGNVHAKGIFVSFTLENGIIDVIETHHGNLPVSSEVHKAIKELQWQMDNPKPVRLKRGKTTSLNPPATQKELFA